jgi:hypothetical protein
MRVDELVWNAARRLACLVVGGLGLVGALVVGDAVVHRGAIVAELSAWTAAYLVVGALVALSRARHFFARTAEPPAAVDEPYRGNAHVVPDDPDGRERARATRCAAGALFALAVAGAFVIVAAAAR